jgi:hypothetical protein
MFGVIDFTTSFRNKHRLVVYTDLPSAISFFDEIKTDDVKVFPCINENSLLLTFQNYPYNITNLDVYHIPHKSILNISISRDLKVKTSSKGNPDNDFNCSIKSILLKLEQDDILLLKEHYTIYNVNYCTYQCSLCSSDFKVWDATNNGGYYGCVYNPTYYKIILVDELEDYHIFGQQERLNNKILKFNIKQKAFCVIISGRYQGLMLAKFQLPDTWESNNMICWNCMYKMEEDFVHIWGH